MHAIDNTQVVEESKPRKRKPTKFEWYKRYPRAYLDATRRLSLGARGAYSDLLDLMYLDEHGRIPDDNRWIACALHVTIHRWRAARDELFAAGKLFAREGHIYNAKAREVHAERLEAAAATITSRDGVHHYDLFSFGINGGVATDKKTKKKKDEKKEGAVVSFPSGLPEAEADKRVTLEDGKLILHNGLRTYWLGRFNGDEGALELALMEAAPYVQPNGLHSLETKVSGQLARQLNNTKRYARPAGAPRANARIEAAKAFRAKLKR